jgi:hypothetical protein
MIEFARWLIFLLLIAIIVVVIALVLSLILGILFAVLYLVPYGYWTDRYNTLLQIGIGSIPVGLIMIFFLIALDKRLEKQRKPRKYDE